MRRFENWRRQISIQKKGRIEISPNVVNGARRCGTRQAKPKLDGLKKRNRRNERDKPDKINEHDELNRLNELNEPY